ncbi:Nfx1-type zinc finger-containing protein [Fragilaria crotonensis]|nr:Nfx1-type zinc finger-containing protein [Fragilaria crotonensis]
MLAKERIVRIGGRSRSPQVAPYQLRVLSRQQPQGRLHMSALRQVDAQLYKMQEEIEQQILLLKEPVTWEFPLGGIKSLLDVEYPDFSQYLRIPDLMDGFDLIGRGNRKVSKDFLFETWKRGDSVPEWLDPCMQVNSSGFLTFWTLDHVDRLSLVEVWRAQILQPAVNELIAVTDRFNDLMAEKQMIRRAIDGDILTQARVIGVTTTGAAQYREMLSEKAAGVVVVEEAGEVLEAHVLSSLSVGTKHLILIGDHKQLRPKTETYNLTTSANKGYNLDRSLFERLVVSQLPATSLTIQRRMRPEISDFVRSQTYPDLVDHDAVFRRPNVRGVKLNVAFVDHDVPEDGHSQVDNASKTKANRYEAEFCIEIVRYLLLQGYRPSDIVVLTPYVGQLVHIASFMKQNLKEVTAYVSESDAIELDDLGVEGVGQSNSSPDDTTSNNVRCSSIDNFQGEEAEIVVVSLVRSNPSGMIGFLKEPQRVNVLLSRARSGMFLVGNQKTLTLKSGNSVWSPLFDLMHQRGQIQKGLPSVCQLHPQDDEVILRSVEDFRNIGPTEDVIVRACFVCSADTPAQNRAIQSIKDIFVRRRSALSLVVDSLQSALSFTSVRRCVARSADHAPL